jgi:hypothetical protein
MKTRILFTLMLVGLMVLYSGGAQAQPVAPPTVVLPTANIPEWVTLPDVVPGQLVRFNGLGALAPPPRTGVMVEGITLAGESVELTLVTQADGDVRAQAEGASDPGAPGSNPSPCSDDAKNVQGRKWFTTFNWWFISGSTPSYLSVDNTEASLTEAVRNIIHSENNCGLTDQVSASASYQGRRAGGVEINSDNSCGTHDSYNETGFGNLTGYLALACVWYNVQSGFDEIVHSDVRVNTDFLWWNTLSSCDNRWMVEPVMTHERGHTFGLGHVLENGHGRLTMSPAINGKCQMAESSLGYGDVLGLRAIY